MMIHSTNNTIRPMMIQVMAVEDIRGSSAGGRLWSAGAIYGLAGAEGSGRYTPINMPGNATSHRSLP
jgi:hypothetical protein